MRSCFLMLLAGLCAGITAPSQAAAITGTIFDPSGGGYTSLGSQSFSSGTLTFNTDTLTLSHSTLGTIGSGVVDSSASGKVQMAVFNFDSLTITSGATVNVVGNLGLAITSRDSITLGTNINLVGTAGSFGTTSPQAGGSGAPGAEGGVRNSGVSASAPPSGTAGDGGAGKVLGTAVTADSGVGLGAGSGASHDGSAASNGGGGGSYGGVGGTGQKANTVGTAGSGGNTYGNGALDDLFGGSGGGGGVKQSSSSGGGGGGGGGSVALIAEAAIHLTSQVSTKGGSGGIIDSTSGNPTGGGGGSGGGILLAADLIDFNGTLDASGGNGGYRPGDGSDRAGGSGGGGRIALYYNTLSGVTPVTGTNVQIGGGLTETATAGGAGSFLQGAAPAYLNVPEPGGLLMVAGAMGVLWRRHQPAERSSAN